MATLTIQPSNIDNWLIQNAPTTNFGDSTDLYLRSLNGSSNIRPILKFDFSALPAGAVISAATSSLYNYGRGADPVGRTYWAYELTQTAWVELESTWNSYKTGSAWAAAGGDYTTGDGASLVVPVSLGWMDWNVLALVNHFQSTHAKVANFLMKDGTEDSAEGYIAYFHSNNYTTNLTLRPKLVLEYTVVSDTDKFFMMFD